MEFEEELKKLRKTTGCTQGQFGEMFGLNQQSISELESGKKNPSKTLMAFLKYRYPDIFDDGNTTESITQKQNFLSRVKDPERVLRLKHKIVDIKNVSEELFGKVETYIEGIHTAAQVLTDKDTRNDEAWDGLERREKMEPWEVGERRRNGTKDE